MRVDQRGNVDRVGRFQLLCQHGAREIERGGQPRAVGARADLLAQFAAQDESRIALARDLAHQRFRRGELLRDERQRGSRCSAAGARRQRDLRRVGMVAGGAQGVLDGLGRVLDEADRPASSISHFVYATTLVTNLLVEGSDIPVGLITTKDGSLEDADVIEARIRGAAEYVPLERLALSPQCGFATFFEGNPLSWDQQRRKLELVAETARQTWR